MFSLVNEDSNVFFSEVLYNPGLRTRLFASHLEMDGIRLVIAIVLIVGSQCGIVVSETVERGNIHCEVARFDLRPVRIG
jgi:hypothetical protein